ncbi:MAG: hypothetical protein M1835_004019, partial [Candelina submexicana]
LYRRNVFYAGGQYVNQVGASGRVFTGQLYVEQLTPATGDKKPYPIVFFHGAGINGATFLNTPDNRRGWASYFIEHGYEVFLLDHTSVGRSSRQPTELAANGVSAENAVLAFTAPQNTPYYPQAVNHTQWPGPGTIGDPTFDAFYASFEQFSANREPQQLAMRDAGCALLQRIGASFLLAHSAGGLFPWIIADKCPSLVRGTVALETDTNPFHQYTGGLNGTATRRYGLTDAPITYSPPVINPDTDLKKQIVGSNSLGNHSCILQEEPAKQLPSIAKVPVFFITAPASVHITYDHCTVAYLRQAG